MKISVQVADIAAIKVDLLIVNLFEGVRVPGGATRVADQALDGAITKLIADGEIKGKRGEWTLVHAFGRQGPARVAVLGLGKASALDTEAVRWAMGDAVRAARSIGARRVATVLHGAGAGGLSPEEAARAITEGALMGLYRFDKYKAKSGPVEEVADLVIVERDATEARGAQRGVEVGRAIGESICLARDMINEPANFMNPSGMAAVAARVGRECGLEVEALEQEEMERLGMGAILAVARGSAQPPRFIIMRYWGDPAHRERALGLVGKGVTFDTGGISLKRPEGMAAMKSDMSGGASVIAAMRAIGILKPGVNVTGLVPAAENMPSGTAQRPGDVLRAFSGKTVEVENTDAEGRLLLADALSYGRKLGLSPMIDVATLTGAIRMALGDVCTGAFTNHQPTLDRLMKSAATAGEKLWQMPMFEEFREQNRSDVADVKNTGGRTAGAIAAAWFLREFAEDTPWVHLDIAGTARRDSTRGYLVRGASGVSIRMMVQFALDSVRHATAPSQKPTQISRKA